MKIIFAARVDGSRNEIPLILIWRSCHEECTFRNEELDGTRKSSRREDATSARPCAKRDSCVSSHSPKKLTVAGKGELNNADLRCGKDAPPGGASNYV